MNKRHPNMRLLISRYFDSMINLIDLHAEELLEKLNKTTKNEDKLSDDTTQQLEIDTIRHDMIDKLRGEEGHAYQRYQLIRDQLKLNDDESRTEEDIWDLVMSKIFSNKFFFLMLAAADSESPKNNFELVLIEVEFYMDRFEKLMFRKFLFGVNRNGFVYFGGEKRSVIENFMVDPTMLKINLDKRYFRARILRDHVIRLVTRSPRKHAFALKSSDLFSIREFKIFETLFQFQHIDFHPTNDRDIFRHLEWLGYHCPPSSSGTAAAAKVPYLENLSCFGNLKSLCLINVRLKDTSFCGLAAQLVDLTLSSCNFHSFSAASFRFTPNIQRLVCLDPIDFDRVGFERLTRLKTLTLKSNDYKFNQLDTLNPGTLRQLNVNDSLSDTAELFNLAEHIKHLTGLEELSVKLGNKITCFDCQWMVLLNTLKTLRIRLDRQKLSVNLENEESLPNLSKLVFESSRFQQSQGIVDGIRRINLAGLKSLKLKDCSIQFDPDGDGLFSGLGHLEELYLINVRLESPLSKSFLSGLVNLKRLDLRNNQLTEIAPNALMQTPNLTHLVVADNQLSVLSANTFELLTKLESLNLVNNRISILDHGLFGALKNVKTLNLSSNPIERVVDGSGRLVFEGMDNLTELIINGTRLDRIEPVEVFDSLASLNRVAVNTIGNSTARNQLCEYYSNRVSFEL